jgi:hypothetical protein
VDDLKVDKSLIDSLVEGPVNDTIVALKRGLRIYAGSQGHRRRGGVRPAGGEPEGHEVRSGPGFLFLETATQGGGGEANGDEPFMVGV